MIERGFYVWNPEASKPRFRHDSFNSAVTESERLAKENPGAKFIVLEIKENSHVERHPEVFKAAEQPPQYAWASSSNYDDDLPF